MTLAKPDISTVDLSAWGWGIPDDITLRGIFEEGCRHGARVALKEVAETLDVYLQVNPETNELEICGWLLNDIGEYAVPLDEYTMLCPAGALEMADRLEEMARRIRADPKKYA